MAFLAKNEFWTYKQLSTEGQKKHRIDEATRSKSHALRAWQELPSPLFPPPPTSSNFISHISHFHISHYHLYIHISPCHLARLGENCRSVKESFNVPILVANSLFMTFSRTTQIHCHWDHSDKWRQIPRPFQDLCILCITSVPAPKVGLWLTPAYSVPWAVLAVPN